MDRTATKVRATGEQVREEKRQNGSVQANAHANAQAQAHANENSVLNGTVTADGITRVNGEGTVKTLKTKKEKAETESQTAVYRSKARTNKQLRKATVKSTTSTSSTSQAQANQNNNTVEHSNSASNTTKVKYDKRQAAVHSNASVNSATSLKP